MTRPQQVIVSTLFHVSANRFTVIKSRNPGCIQIYIIFDLLWHNNERCRLAEVSCGPSCKHHVKMCLIRTGIHKTKNAGPYGFNNQLDGDQFEPGRLSQLERVNRARSGHCMQVALDPLHCIIRLRFSSPMGSRLSGQKILNYQPAA